MPYTVGEYLLDRLSELHINHLFGVPGDFNLVFLDTVLNHKNIKWVGNCNELNGAYCVDGYARVNGMGAILTTFGVGELSALNGIAGSYAEDVPIIHIVGAPLTASKTKKELLHHTLGDGDFEHAYRASNDFSSASFYLTLNEPEKFIDEALIQAYHTSKPVFLYLPIDVALKPTSKPKAKLNLNVSKNIDLNSQKLATTIIKKLKEAKQPVLIVGHQVDRVHQSQALLKWIESANLPVASLPLGKGAIDETSKCFIGTYVGIITPNKSVFDYIATSDCVIALGTLFTDMATGGFTHKLDLNKTIQVNLHDANVLNQISNTDISLLNVIKYLTANQTIKNKAVFPKLEKVNYNVDNKKFSYDMFWSAICNFLKPDDILLCDIGTSVYAGIATNLKTKTTFITNILWSSIGHALPASIGAKIANPSRRVVLFEGDGAANLTFQEWGTLFESGLNNYIIFLINNKGYSIERAIHGLHAKYNDIAKVNYAAVFQAFDFKHVSKTYQITDQTSLDKTLKILSDQPNQVSFVEVCFDPLDWPLLLQQIHDFNLKKQK